MAQRKAKLPNISDFIRRFLEEPGQDPNRKRNRESVMGLFNDYLAGYGEVESNVERDPLMSPPPSRTSSPDTSGSFSRGSSSAR